MSGSDPLAVTLEYSRGRAVRERVVLVPAGTTVRALLRAEGQAPEGCAVLVGETPLPLDTPIVRAMRLTIVPTFSGG